MSGSWRSGPKPPVFRGWVDQAKWEYLESVDMPEDTNRSVGWDGQHGKGKPNLALMLRVL
jgi:hypothetical protein